MFNAANAVFLPLLRLRRLQRSPRTWTAWNGAGPSRELFGRRYYRVAEALSVRWSDALIADARGIQRLLPRDL